MSHASQDKSASAVAHEAEDLRANLAHTLEQLRDNLKPEHVIQEVVGNARVGAGSLMDGLYSLARDNPLSALLIGAGCAAAFGFGSQTAFKGKAIIDIRPDDTAGFLRRDVEPVTADINVSPGQPLNEKINSFSATVHETMSRSTDRFSLSGSRLSGLLHDQPLIIAALGVAVGAALGASLPTTKIEDQWMGDTSSALKHAAQDAARSEIDGLKAVASRTADNLKNSAVDHGLSGENISDLVHEAGAHARAAINDVGPQTDRFQPS